MVKTPLRPTCRVIFFGNFHIVAHGPAELRTDAKSQEKKYGTSVVPGVSKSGLKVNASKQHGAHVILQSRYFTSLRYPPKSCHFIWGCLDSEEYLRLTLIRKTWFSPVRLLHMQVEFYVFNG